MLQTEAGCLRTTSLLALIYLKIFGCAGSPLLSELSSSCGSRDDPLVAVRRLLIAVASLVSQHEL